MEEVWMEIEALRSIFEDEIIVEERGSDLVFVKKKVRPSDDEKKSSASVHIQFSLTPEYPEKSPCVLLSNPRGLSESDHVLLEREVQQRLRDNLGMPVIYEILQFCSDFLLEHQHSSTMLCPICLCSLAEDDVIGTPCDHYIHKMCMNEHTLHTRRMIGEKLQNLPTHMHSQVEKSLLCPVCREVVEDEVEPILPSSSKQKSGRRSEKFRVSTSKSEKFEFDWNRWKEEQRKMAEIYEKQRNQGGIIDLEEERRKNLITEDTVITLPTSSNEPSSSDVPGPSEPPKPPVSSKNGRQDHFRPGRREFRPHSSRGNHRGGARYHQHYQNGKAAATGVDGEQKTSSGKGGGTRGHHHHRHPRGGGNNSGQPKTVPPSAAPAAENITA